MVSYQIGTATTLALAIIALWLGLQINQKLPLLQRYNIPAAVSGGLLISTLIALLEALGLLQLRFELALRDLLLIVFFSTIGLSARFSEMLAGGRALAIMLGLAVLFLLAQNLLSTLLALLLGLPPLQGLIGGSISLAGGHGTALAWGQLLETEFDIPDASTIGITFATAGLVMGGLTGGPVAAWLIRRHQLQSEAPEQETVGIDQTAASGAYTLRVDGMLTAIFLITLCFGLGALLYEALEGFGLRLPAFLTAMFLGILLSNGLDMFRGDLDRTPIRFIGDLSLQLFLGMSLISMPLLALQGAIGAVTLIIVMQAVLIAAFTVWIVFPALGRNYDAACIGSGFIGMGLGATPVGIANMNAITHRFGPSPQAFLVIPLLGAFFIDIANATLLQLLMGLPWYGS